MLLYLRISPWVDVIDPQDPPPLLVLPVPPTADYREELVKGVTYTRWDGATMTVIVETTAAERRSTGTLRLTTSATTGMLTKVEKEALAEMLRGAVRVETNTTSPELNAKFILTPGSDGGFITTLPGKEYWQYDMTLRRQA